MTPESTASNNATSPTKVPQTLSPLPPMRRRWRSKILMLLVGLFVVVMLCYPASLIARGIVGATYIKQGDTALSNGNLAEATTNYLNAMSWNTDSEVPYAKRMDVAYATGDWDAALADYTMAINNNPDVFLGYCYRADIYRNILQDDQQALSNYRDCLRLNPDPDSGWAQNAQRAIAHINKAQ